MANSGITVQKTYTGKPTAITFNLHKWGVLLRDFFAEKQIDFPIVEKSTYDKNFTKKLNESIKQYENGQYHSVDMNNFWND